MSQTSNFPSFNLLKYVFFINTIKTQITDFNINYTIENSECKQYNYTFYKQPWIKKYNFSINNKWDKKEKYWID